tara:strand:+ start:27 stop:452 length:426 start_codon:yes stop_codon:yes gene_type:complete
MKLVGIETVSLVAIVSSATDSSSNRFDELVAELQKDDFYLRCSDSPEMTMRHLKICGELRGIGLDRVRHSLQPEMNQISRGQWGKEFEQGRAEARKVIETQTTPDGTPGEDCGVLRVAHYERFGHVTGDSPSAKGCFEVVE